MRVWCLCQKGDLLNYNLAWNFHLDKIVVFKLSFFYTNYIEKCITHGFIREKWYIISYDNKHLQIQGSIHSSSWSRNIYVENDNTRQMFSMNVSRGLKLYVNYFPVYFNHIVPFNVIPLYYDRLFLCIFTKYLLFWIG